MEKEKIRNDKYLNYIVPLIVKGIHCGQEYIANSEDQEKIIMDELTDFIQQKLEKAREEGEKKYQKSEFLIDSAGNVYMDTMPRIRIGDNTKHDGTTVGDFRRLYYKIN